VVDRAGPHTRLVDIILGSFHLLWEENMSESWLFSNSSETFREDNKLLTWDVIFLDCFANDFFRDSIGVNIGCIPCVESSVICSFQER
jgi:hypothetical protein